MSVLSTEEQALLDWLLSSIPRWLWMDDPTRSAQEVWASTVKSLILGQRQGEDWIRATYILTAEGVWLNQHAKDRGTGRQADESDVALRERLRSYEDAVTNPFLLTLVQAILDAEGISGTAALLELRRDKAHFQTHTPLGGDGTTPSTFTKNGGEITLDTGVSLSGYERGELVTIASATSGGNDGSFPVIRLYGDTGLVYENAAGVTEALGAGTTWQVDTNGNNRKTAYMGRGYRMARPRSAFIVILPYGSTAATAAAVREALRQKKGGGILVYVERRTSP